MKYVIKATDINTGEPVFWNGEEFITYTPANEADKPKYTRDEAIQIANDVSIDLIGPTAKIKDLEILTA